MKSLYMKLAWVALLMLGSQYVHAALFGWSTTISARDGDSFHSQRVSAGTFPDCQVERQRIIEQWMEDGYEIISDSDCAPVVVNFGALVPPEVRWPWPGPVCLSCPYLTDENIKFVYPKYFDRVQGLVKQFDIKNYNKELLELQESYNLEAFEKEMFKIELGQQIAR